MKKRSVIYKAEWSNTREDKYRTECEAILFKENAELIFSDFDVYLLSENNRTFFIKINKLKSKWYEIWLELKNK